MSEQDTQDLETFGQWLRGLAEDAVALLEVVGDTEQREAARRPLAGALNYLFKSLDLIDDGIEGLGFLDDAFVLRIAARRAAGEGGPRVAELAEEAAHIEAFLGDTYGRLVRFTETLDGLTVRGRSVDALLTDATLREELVGDVRGWAQRYEAPFLGDDVRSLVKLRSFLDAKLPA